MRDKIAQLLYDQYRGVDDKYMESKPLTPDNRVSWKGFYVRAEAVANLIASTLPEMSEEELTLINVKWYGDKTANLSILEDVVKAYQDKIIKSLRGE